MIIPVGINHVIRGLPWVTISIIAICTAVHIYAEEFAPQPEEVRAFIETRERELLANPDDARATQILHEVEEEANKIPIVRLGYRTDSGLSWRLVSSAFVHGGWLHLIGNMLFLWLAGAALEDRWGRLRFAGFYLAGAVVSGLFFDMLYSGEETTLVGASGAISALMGAFLVCFARMQIHFIYWLGGIGRFDAVAYIALPVWFGEQLLEGWLHGASGGVSSIAFTAHIGGFLFGLAVAGIARIVAHPRDEEAEPRAAEPQPAAPARPSAKLPKPIEPPKAEAPLAPGEGPRFLG